MIYTVTLNPSLDYTVFTDRLNPGVTNRSQRELIFAGGKGINVSSYLCSAGIPNLALGFLAGFTGAEIRRMLSERGIREEMIMLPEGMSRINVKIKADIETEINGSGPLVTNEALEELLSRIDRIGSGDHLVLSGSVPPSVPRDIYLRIAQRIEGSGVLLSVDSEGDLLRTVLPLRPFIVKPNQSELSSVLGTDIGTFEEALQGADRLQRSGAQNVIVSLGELGAVLKTGGNECFICRSAEGRAVNSVGAGDCLLASFLSGYVSGKSMEECLRLGVAAGCACAFGEGLSDPDKASKIISEVNVLRV
ncbi:MAG: 1-phosphofructokinase [Clostridiales bacterium]|nr:1-phosphofructokinase [Clostridiales bacterium]